MCCHILVCSKSQRGEMLLTSDHTTRKEKHREYKVGLIRYSADDAHSLTTILSQAECL